MLRSMNELTILKKTLTKRDEKLRDTAYRRTIKIFEEAPEDHYCGKYIDYGTAILSQYSNPPVPQAYVPKIKDAIEGFIKINKIEDKITDPNHGASLLAFIIYNIEHNIPMGREQ